MSLFSSVEEKAAKCFRSPSPPYRVIAKYSEVTNILFNISVHEICYKVGIFLVFFRMNEQAQTILTRIILTFRYGRIEDMRYDEY